LKKNQKGSNRAKEILEQIGFDEVTDLSMKDLLAGFDIIYLEEELNGSDGKIIRGKLKTIIKVDSNISTSQRKRFVAAHELGHFFLHKKLEFHLDNQKTLSWHRLEETYQKGIQEIEANDFAGELLMPEKVFKEFISGESFGQALIKEISLRFNTSLTSVIFRMITLDIAPIFVAFIVNGVVQYWRKTSDLKCWVNDITKLPPPEFSVAKEYIDANYEFIYEGPDKTQIIDKSTWFKLDDQEEDIEFYEYCIPTKKYKTIISVIWEA
jgi:Zn-dependent peptidase ImmA (M78 family)|tara:strand:+ start:204 stop:1004 length:801 start_codon:yes stop_codon:yes gene_type:complete